MLAVSLSACGGTAPASCTSCDGGTGGIDAAVAVEDAAVAEDAAASEDATVPDFCGDDVCNGAETCTTCLGDCGECPPVCGDFVCNGTDTCSTCPGDCGACIVCGDDECTGSETCSTCPGDCGACPATCDATSCGGGCCGGDVCRSGDLDTSCGSSGEECVDCGARFNCVAGSCVDDPAAGWIVVVDSVTLTPNNRTGAGWDLTSGPDPLILVRVISEDGPFARIEGPDNTLTIEYTTGNTAGPHRADTLETFLRFEVYDEDLDGDDRVCFVTYADGAGFALTSSEVTARCTASAATGDSDMTMTWHLEPS